MPSPDPGSSPKELSIYLQVLEQGRPLVASPTGIQAFREKDNLDVITKLVQMAKLDDRPIRVNATLILANVVDNTTVCGVLNALFDDMNENALFNLLQVRSPVSSYALVEQAMDHGDDESLAVQARQAEVRQIPEADRTDREDLECRERICREG